MRSKRRRKELGCPFLDINGRDVIQKIMKYLPVKDIISLGLTCKQIKLLCEKETLWYYLLMRDYNVTKNVIFDTDALSKDIYKQEQKFEREQTWPFKHFSLLIISKSCRFGNMVSVKCCLRRGIDINIADVYGWTPLIIASTYGHKELVEFLLLVGADKNHVTLFGETAHMRANTKEIRKLLEK